MLGFELVNPIVEDGKRAVFAGHSVVASVLPWHREGRFYGRIIRYRHSGKRVMKLSETPKRDYRPVTLVMK